MVVSPLVPPDGEERLRGIVEAMIDPWVLLEAVRDGAGTIIDFRYVDANTAACRINAIPRERLLGSRLGEQFPDLAAGDLFADFVAVVETGTPLVLDDYPYTSRDSGEPGFFDNRGVRVGDGLSLTWRDVTARHRAVAELSESRRELADKEARFRAAMTYSAAGMATLDTDRGFTEVNPALCRMLDLSPEWLLEHGLADVMHTDDSAADLVTRRQLLAGELAGAVREQRLIGREGDVVWVQHALGVIRDADGQPTAFVSQFVDITASRQARALVEAATEAIVEPFAIWQVATHDPRHTRLVRANPAIALLLEQDRDDLIGRSLAEILPVAGPDAIAVAHADLVAAAQGNAPLTGRDVTGPPDPDGGPARIWRPTLSPVGQRLVAVLFRDVTDEVATAQRLARERDEAARVAAQDPLTDLPNRRALMAVLDAALDVRQGSGDQLAVLYCDVDGLKPVNDTLGHAAGDRLIRAVAHRLRAGVRGQDTVARLGGDEFVVVVPGIADLDDARRVAEHLRRTVAEPIGPDVGGGPEQGSVVTVSIGVTLAVSGEHPATVLDRADQALYDAKLSGRDRVVVLPGDGSPLTARD